MKATLIPHLGTLHHGSSYRYKAVMVICSCVVSICVVGSCVDGSRVDGSYVVGSCILPGLNYNESLSFCSVQLTRY